MSVILSSNSPAGKPLVAIAVISDLEFGGAQRQVVELANHADPDKCILHVVALQAYTPLAQTLKDTGRRLHIIPRRSKFDFTVVTRLKALITKLNATVVHGYLFDAEIATRLAGRATGAAVIGSERNTDYCIKPINHFAYRITRRCHDLTIANSRAGAQFNSRLLGQPIDRYRVVHNGVDVTRFMPRDGAALRVQLGLKPDQPVVGMFASFKPQKNHPLLLRAARRVLETIPGARFLFVGDELFKGMDGSVEFKRTIQRTVEELGIGQNCIFVGNRKDVENYYNVCTITALPSLFEGTPNVALESMASGVPIVATNVSDNAYIIPDQRAGLVVPSGDEANMANAICRLLMENKMRESMANFARSWVVEEFSCGRMAEKTLAVYREAAQFQRNRLAAKGLDGGGEPDYGRRI